MSKYPFVDLVEARQDFVQLGDPVTAANLLEAAYDAWNEEVLSEQDYVEEVQGIKRWLRRLADEGAEL